MNDNIFRKVLAYCMQVLMVGFWLQQPNFNRELVVDVSNHIYNILDLKAYSFHTMGSVLSEVSSGQ